MSINTKPGNNHGKPPNNKNLENSKIINILAMAKLLKKIFWLNCMNRANAKGAINTPDRSIPINNIIMLAIIILVSP